ncbi:MAG: hypothetical protein ACRDR6_09405 [Pseudonocardiaceae bacterium]
MATADGPVDYPDLLFLVAVIAVWGTVALLLAAIVVRETIDWWYRRRSRGAHHPESPTARTVMEIDQRLRREATGLRPPRVIVVRRRIIASSSALITPPAAHWGSQPKDVPFGTARAGHNGSCDPHPR